MEISSPVIVSNTKRKLDSNALPSFNTKSLITSLSSTITTKKESHLDIYYSSVRKIYPFHLICKMLRMNRLDVSERMRRIGLQYEGRSVGQPTEKWGYFNDINQEYFKVLIQANPPQSIHVQLLLPLKVESTSYKNKYPRSNVELRIPLNNTHWSKDSTQVVQPEKEIIFDIDLTDYKRYCSCQELSKSCNICWSSIEGTYLILKHYLESVFAYKSENIMYVFSGSKGIHVFLNSPLILRMSDSERYRLYQIMYISPTNSVKLLEYIEETQEMDDSFVKKVESFFVQSVIKKRNMFQYKSFEAHCLSLIKENYCRPLYDEIEKNWIMNDSVSSMIRWESLLKIERSYQHGYKVRPSLLIIFRLYYPMIDKGPLAMNHLIKLPFSVHSVTQNIALPVEGETIISMDIEKDSLSLIKLCQHFMINKEIHPSYRKGVEIMERWVKHYS